MYEVRSTLFNVVEHTAKGSRYVYTIIIMDMGKKTCVFGVSTVHDSSKVIQHVVELINKHRKQQYT